METFASIKDYEDRYGDVSDTITLSEVLQDATRLIQASLKASGIDPSEADAGSLMQVCRTMAYRSMGDEPGTPFGATQFTQAAGEFTESYSFRNPYGEVYLTKAEKKLLGIGRARIGFVGGA